MAIYLDTSYDTKSDCKHRGRLRAPGDKQGGIAMSVAKIIEISCESTKSFEDAITSGIARASKTVHNIKGAWIKEQQVLIDNGKVTMFRVDLKVTFVLD
jgi:flavin-binding protein dodecin